MRSLALTAVIVATAGLSQPALGAEPAAKPKTGCFFSNDWRGWKASPDARSIYIRVGVRQIYKVDFTAQCPFLTQPLARLITSTPTGTVCRPLDLDIKVATPGGFPTPCLVDRLTALTPAEAAALPKALTP